MRITTIAAIIAATLLCVPAAAQNIATVPSASALSGGERMLGAQGTGCTTNVSPCAAVAVTPAQLATYLAPTFQASDADLTAIAALSTTPFGRGILALVDAPTVRSYIGLGSNATDSTPRVPTSLTISTAAPLAGGGALTGNLALSIAAATGSAPGTMSAADKAKLDGIAAGATANTGTVTNVSGTGANGVNVSTANGATTPALTIGLGAIVPTSITTGAISGSTGTFTGALAASNFSGSSSGTNTGDQTRASLGAAASGSNNDIIALTGLTTALPVTEGGTGRTTARPALIAGRAAANLSTAFQTVSQSFTTVTINAATLDTAAGFSTSTYLYTVPETGVYVVVGRLRLVDGTAAGISVALGIDTANNDTVGLTWATTAAATAGYATSRNGLVTTRVMSLTAGQTLRLFAFGDSSSGVGVSAAELSAYRIN